MPPPTTTTTTTTTTLRGLVALGVCLGLVACTRLASPPYRWTWDSLGQRIAWMNVERFANDPINEQTLAILMDMNTSKAMDILDELEKQKIIPNPNSYLRMAARWEGVGKDWETSSDLVNFHKMVEYLNDEVFPDVPLDARAIRLLASVDLETSRRLVGELTERMASIWNPGVYLAERLQELGFPSEVDAEDGEDQFWDAREEAEEETWHDAAAEEAELPAKPPAAAVGQPRQRRVGANGTIFRTYLARFAQVMLRDPHLEPKEGPGQSAGKIRMRADWMNRHVLGHRPIDTATIEAMMKLNASKAMNLYAELERHHAVLRSPSEWLQWRMAREQAAVPSQAWQPEQAWSQ